MTEPHRFPDSVFDRIGGYLPAEQRASYFRYLAHLKTFNPTDELLILAEGMALFVCIARQVPEAIAGEREKLLAELGRLTTKHETATSAATVDTRAMFQAHQKHLEQNMAAWQNKEQHAIQSLERVATRFDESAKDAAVKLQRVCNEFQSATKEHQAAALKAQQWVERVSLESRVWPYVACCASGAVVTIAVRYFLERSGG